MTRRGGGAGVGPVQLRPALPAASTPIASRRTSAQRLAHPFPEQRLPRADVRRGAAQLLRPAAAHRGPDARRARPPRPRHPGRQRRAARRAHPGRARCGSSRSPGTCTRPRSPRSTRRSRAFLARRGRAAVSVPMALGDELRVADVIRRQAARARRRRRAPPRRAGAHLRELDERSNRLAQALLAAGVGPGARVALPRPHGARGDRAAVRGEQDRRRARAAQLAAGGARARRDRRRRRRAAADRRRARSRDRGAAIAARCRRRAPIVVGARLRARGSPRHDPVDPGGARRGGRRGRADVHVRARPASPRACSPRTATSPPPPRRRRAGRSTPTRSASRRCRCSTSAASAGRSSGCGTARPRSWSASSTPRPCSTCSSASA